MKVEKFVCDVCGTELYDNHPARLVLQEYDVAEVDTWRGSIQKKGYKNKSTYDICKKCAAALPNIRRGAK